MDANSLNRSNALALFFVSAVGMKIVADQSQQHPATPTRAIALIEQCVRAIGDTHQPSYQDAEGYLVSRYSNRRDIPDLARQCWEASLRDQSR